MTWNQSLPADASKLRLSAGLIRTNWKALEEGGVPFDSLRLQQQAVAPTRLAGHGWLFTANPGSGQTELFYEDDRNPGMSTQLTSGVGSPVPGIGAAGQLIYGSALIFSGTYQNVQDSFVSAWARCQGTASGFLGTAFHIASCTRTATGEYTIATDATFLDGDVAVIGTTRQLSSDTPGTFNWLVKSFAAGVVTITVEVKNRSGQHDDRAFDIMILGGR